ncbi:MAG: NADH:flavin oxidoreductase/NADH oxidase [Dehalococcoidia bacterium]|nr:NADH:flavin oxidoreductase/NADH oxidase [Dehalococcoidia bacterium]
MSQLFTSYKLRDIEFPNRVFVSPVSQYSSDDGVPGKWHLVHLGSRAVGGAGMVMTEATAINARGRITTVCAGIWNDEQAEAWKPITSFITENGSVPCVQLAHAGRKGSQERPWLGGGFIRPEDGGWQTVGASAEPYDEGWGTPDELTESDIDALVDDWRAAALRSLEAGFKVVEIHLAHGFLGHSFLSPLSNHREDSYGGNADNRMRFPLRIVDSVREAWPEKLPLLVRISATDWVEGSGWDLPDAVKFSKVLKEHGVDLVDCSSGGVSPRQQIAMEPGYQVPFADSVRSEADVPTAAVGLITEARHAEDVLESGKADVIFLGRELLRNPYWPLHAAIGLGDDTPWPHQYIRSKPVS